MDPATIAAAAVAILMPYVKDAGTEVVKTIGEAAVEKTKGLLGWLKGRFMGDASATKDLSRFEGDPEGYEKALKTSIKEKVDADPAFGAELSKRVEEIKAVTKVRVDQTVKDGDELMGLKVRTIKSGVDASVTQNASNVKKVTGMDIDSIG